MCGGASGTELEADESVGGGAIDCTGSAESSYVLYCIWHGHHSLAVLPSYDRYTSLPHRQPPQSIPELPHARPTVGHTWSRYTSFPSAYLQRVAPPRLQFCQLTMPPVRSSLQLLTYPLSPFVLSAPQNITCSRCTWQSEKINKKERKRNRRVARG
jgi:hypothetical protein